jgi:hypothetical protein
VSLTRNSTETVPSSANPTDRRNPSISAGAIEGSVTMK